MTEPLTLQHVGGRIQTRVGVPGRESGISVSSVRPSACSTAPPAHLATAPHPVSMNQVSVTHKHSSGCCVASCHVFLCETEK